MKKSRSTLKTYFETGDVPTQSQFSDSFDSEVIWNDDVVTDLTTNDDDHIPTVKAVADAIAAIPSGGVQSVSGTTVDNTDPTNPVINVPTLDEVLTAGNTTTQQIITSDTFKSRNAGSSYVEWADAGANCVDEVNNRTQALIFSFPITSNETLTLPNKTDTIATLGDIPSLSTFVPYTGATSDVDLDTYGLNANYLKVKGTGGDGKLGLKHQSSAASASASESVIYASNAGAPMWKNDSATVEEMMTGGTYGTVTNNLTAKTTPVDADLVAICDSGATNVPKKVSFTNLWTNYLKSKADAVYQAILTSANFGSFSNGLTAKTTPVDADTINLSDSANSNNMKKLSFTNAWANYFKGKADALYLKQASNLSDLGSASTARTNLGLGTAAVIDYTDWTDFSGSASIVGWTTPTVVFLKYAKISKVVTIIGRITGTSNATTVSMTLPFAAANLGGNQSIACVVVTNNGTTATTPGQVQVVDNSTTLNILRDTLGTAWTNSGTKTVVFTFQYHSAS